jgi:hypothetical protein
LSPSLFSERFVFKNLQLLGHVHVQDRLCLSFRRRRQKRQKIFTVTPSTAATRGSRFSPGA